MHKAASGDDLQGLKPEDTQHTGAQADEKVADMQHREPEMLPDKGNIEHEESP